MELRQTYLHRGIQRPVPLELQNCGLVGHHYDRHSLKGNSCNDNGDCDQRRFSLPPYAGGCRDLLAKLIPPMISSFAANRSDSLGVEGLLKAAGDSSLQPQSVSNLVEQNGPLKSEEGAAIANFVDADNSRPAGNECVRDKRCRAFRERKGLLQKHSNPTDRPNSAPTTNKGPPRRTANETMAFIPPSVGGQIPSGVASPPRISPSVSSPNNVSKRAATKTPSINATRTATKMTMQRKESAIPSPHWPPSPLNQRNRIPLRQMPSITPVTPNSVRKALTTQAPPNHRCSPSAIKASKHVQLPGTVVGAPVQSSRVAATRGSTPIVVDTEVKRHIGSPLQRRVMPLLKTPGGQRTFTRTEILEEKKSPLMTKESRPQSSRPLLNSYKKPTASVDIKPAPHSCLPTKPILDGSPICDPVIQEVWSYKEAKDYVMEKMFQGITAICTSAASHKSTTQAVFEEFTIATAEAAELVEAAAKAVVPAKNAKASIVCTLEERKELELFEMVEAEVNKFGENEDEALAQALSPLVENFSLTWIQGKKLPPLPVSDTESMEAIASKVTTENPTTYSENHGMDPDKAHIAGSASSIAEACVLNANDTLMAEAIPPVMMCDSEEKPLVKTPDENPTTYSENHEMDPDKAHIAGSASSIAEACVLNANDTLMAEAIPPVMMCDCEEKPLVKTPDENPTTYSENHGMDPDKAHIAVSASIIVEACVLNANDTLMAEAIPPVMMCDSEEKLLVKTPDDLNMMEAANICTSPCQDVVASKACSLNAERKEVKSSLNIDEGFKT